MDFSSGIIWSTNIFFISPSSADDAPGMRGDSMDHREHETLTEHKFPQDHGCIDHLLEVPIVTYYILLSIWPNDYLLGLNLPPSLLLTRSLPKPRFVPEDVSAIPKTASSPVVCWQDECSKCLSPDTTYHVLCTVCEPSWPNKIYVCIWSNEWVRKSQDKKDKKWMKWQEGIEIYSRELSLHKIKGITASLPFLNLPENI